MLMLHFYNFAPKKEGGNVKLSQLTKTKALVRKTFLNTGIPGFLQGNHGEILAKISMLETTELR